LIEPTVADIGRTVIWRPLGEDRNDAGVLRGFSCGICTVEFHGAYKVDLPAHDLTWDRRVEPPALSRFWRWLTAPVRPHAH
jgi:hypothetical protein